MNCPENIGDSRRINGKNCIKDMENFWNQTKNVLRKYSRIPKELFPLFLEEHKFGFNHITPKQQLRIFQGVG